MSSEVKISVNSQIDAGCDFTVTFESCRFSPFSLPAGPISSVDKELFPVVRAIP